jgi:hydroxymethylpyrimidine pyrophosphatase-like HAD family hydrolase
LRDRHSFATRKGVCRNADIRAKLGCTYVSTDGGFVCAEKVNARVAGQVVEVAVQNSERARGFSANSASTVKRIGIENFQLNVADSVQLVQVEGREMYFLALAADFDGTLAEGSRVDSETWNAILRLQASGRKMVLVTGRSIDSLAQAVPRLEAFDRIVAENGAVLYFPAKRKTVLLSAGPPRALIQELRRRKVEPLWLGEIIVATRAENTRTVLDAIQELDLEAEIATNNKTIMVLPAGANKATGLAVALDDLGISPEVVISVGNGENDTTLFEFAGCGVAVANAEAVVKAKADDVTDRPIGAGVSELMDRITMAEMVQIRRCQITS